MDWNTNDGVFGHCFLVLTWNLSCRAHNTANIWLCEIEWESTFDMFEIYFAHTKTDQTGDEAKYSCHLYANPCCPPICPVLLLAFYFSCCCNLPQSGESQLFPGQDQYQRFSEMLSRLIQDHETEVSELGVNPKMIGMHPIRKGADTYMSSLPGGPSILSVCIHAGWTMGTVKDVYMQYLSSGDQCVGCCLAMLPCHYCGWSLLSIDNFISKVKTAIEECDLASGSLSEQRLQQIFDGFSAEIHEQLLHVGEGTENTEADDAQHTETGQGYRWHYFHGHFHHVLKDWHFAHIGVLDACKQWWIGDSVRGIPPLRMLDLKDLEFLDAIPLSEEEQHGQTGPNKN